MVAKAIPAPSSTAIWSRKKTRQLLLALLFLSPAMLILLIFMAKPLIDAVLLSFQSWDGMRESVWVGLTNYANLLQDRIFWEAVKNTALFTVVTVIIQTTIPLLVANLLNSKIRGSAIFRTLYFMPVVISLTISGLLWSMIYEPNFGVLNETLRALGLRNLAQLWLADRATVMPSIIVVSVWQSLGFYLVIFFAGLQSIPQELYEVASLDGANAWQRLRHVTIPMLRPVMTVVIVLNTIGGIRVFDQVWVMTSGGPNHASETLGTYLYRSAFGARGSSNPQLGYAATIAILILVLSLAISIAQIRLRSRSEVEY
jgi:ABC-type sugar transport system permease subunit